MGSVLFRLLGRRSVFSANEEGWESQGAAAWAPCYYKAIHFLTHPRTNGAGKGVVPLVDIPP